MNSSNRWERFRLGQRASDSQVAERMQVFFERAPVLRPLQGDFIQSIEAESRMSSVQGQSTSVSLPGSLKEFLAMPADLLTEDVLSEGARLSWPMCERCFIPQVTDYAEIVSRLYEKNRNYLTLIHGAFISDLMAAEYVLYGPDRDAWDKGIALTLVKHPQFKMGPLFTHAWVLVGTGIEALGPLFKAQLNESILVAFYKENPAQAGALCPPWMNQTHILEHIVQEGVCPSSLNLDPFLGFPIDNNTSLSDCLAGYQRLSNYDVKERTALSGLIKRYPLDEVINAAKTITQKKTLTALFPSNVLLKLSGRDHVIKGLILEESLGL